MNLYKISLDKEKENVNYTSFNKDSKHKGTEKNISINEIRTEKDIGFLAILLIKKI